jgi:hypothetical protein
VKVSQNGLDLLARVFIHFKDDNTVKLSGNFEGISNLNGFRVAVLRGRDGIALEEKAATLSQGAFRSAGQVRHAEFGIRPDRDRSKGAAIGIPEKNHPASHAFEHAALERQPALAKRFWAGRLNKLAPQISVKLGTGWPF